MSKALKAPTGLIEAVVYFADETRAFEAVRDARWPEGVECPRCGCAKVGFVKSRRIWNCSGCKQQFSAKTGTIFEESPLPFAKWMPAVWLITNAKNGISSCELARALGVTQKTAWFMLHRIREAMQNGSLEKLSGEIEADETFIGGKAANMHKSKREERGYMDGGFGKVVVLGMVARGGRLVTMVVPNRNGKTIKPLVEKHVQKGSTMYTDFHGAYHGLYKDYLHGVVDHEVGYVFGPIHTNTCEGFWSLLKRSMRGTYCAVEPIHLHRYMSEYTFRYNERGRNDAARFALVMGRVSGKRLTYAKLIGKELAAAA